MSFLKLILRAVVPPALLVAVAAISAAGVQVYRVTHPPRHVDQDLDVTTMLVRLEEIGFRASDGTALAGWLLRGSPERPAIVLCHDLGESKAALVNLLIPLHKAGFTLLALDFRGHGKSAGTASTLGLDEKRDVIGAVDYVAALDRIDHHEVGVYGVGQGAHAAVLAAVDRPALKALVLDGLYPDAGYPLVKAAFEGWTSGERQLGFLPKKVFDLMYRTRIDKNRAADVLPSLLGRDLLLVAPAGDAALADQMQRMYATIPEQRETDGNLITLPATGIDGLYGSEIERYHERIVSFFETRLPGTYTAVDPEGAHPAPAKGGKGAAQGS
jgi:pimeloyl-ACP methyl ester carboxylesterase